MIKYEFMRAHGKGSEGSEKREVGANKKGGAEKRCAPYPPFFKKGGARSTRTPPEYATGTESNFLLEFQGGGRAKLNSHPKLVKVDLIFHFKSGCTRSLELAFLS